MPRLITASMETQGHGGHCFAIWLTRTVSAENHEANGSVAAPAPAQVRTGIHSSSSPGRGRGNRGHANLPQSELLGPEAYHLLRLRQQKLIHSPALQVGLKPPET